MDTFQTDGEWWIPSEPNNKIHGQVIYDGIEIAINLYDINDVIYAYLHGHGDEQSPKMLQGRGFDGRLYLLADVYLNTALWKSNGLSKCQCNAFQIFASKSHMPTHVRFPKMWFKCEGLGRFLAEDGGLYLKVKDPDSPRNTNNFELSAEEKLLYEIEYENFSIRIFRKVDTIRNVGVSGDFSLGFYQSYEIEIVSKDVIEIDMYLDIMHKIQILMALAYGTQPALTNIVGAIVVDGKEHALDIASVQSNYANTVKVDFATSRMNFSLKQIESTAEEFLENWLHISDKYEPLAMMIWTITSGNYYDLIGRFLRAVSALEYTHRTQFGGSYVDQKEFRQTILPDIRNAIKDLDLPQELNDSLIAICGYSNQWPLRKRISDMILSYSEILCEFFNSYDPDIFVAELVDSRNHYAHMSKSRKRSKTVVGSKELFEILIYTERIIVIIVMHLARLPSSIIEEYAISHRI